MARIDPLRNFRYRLEIDSVTQAGFSEVMIAETTIDAVDYREGTDPPHVRKLSGLTKYGTVDISIKNRWDNRQYGINFTYRFGKQQGQSRRRNAATEEEQQRVGAGS